MDEDSSTEQKNGGSTALRENKTFLPDYISMGFALTYAIFKDSTAQISQKTEDITSWDFLSLRQTIT